MSLVEKLGFNSWSDLGQFLLNECREEVDGTELQKRLDQLELHRGADLLPEFARHQVGAAQWLVFAGVLASMIVVTAIALTIRYRLARRAHPGEITWGMDGYTLHVRGARKRTGSHRGGGVLGRFGTGGALIRAVSQSPRRHRHCHRR